MMYKFISTCTAIRKYSCTFTGTRRASEIAVIRIELTSYECEPAPHKGVNITFLPFCGSLPLPTEFAPPNLQPENKPKKEGGEDLLPRNSNFKGISSQKSPLQA